MSDKIDDKKDDNKDDPYNFFKFAGPEDNDKKKKDDNNNRSHFPLWALILLVLAVLALVNMFVMAKPDNLIDFSEFRSLIEDGKIVSVELGETYFTGYGPERSVSSDQGAKGYMLFPVQTRSRQEYKTLGVLGLSEGLIDLMNEKGVDYKFVLRQNGYLLPILANLIPIVFIFIMYFLVLRKMGSGMGGGMGSIFGAGQSRAKAVEEGKVKTRFSDVAGVDEAKDELIEVVDFLKQPKKYTDIGGKIPKGVLLVGPPGTGKTLLARAVAGEAGVPFFRISGSDFVEMFVGVGASRVRDLFRQAREKAPCIIFIDELDAIGKSRMNNLGGNDEREQTLNQLLVEMDGFDNEKGLIILARPTARTFWIPRFCAPAALTAKCPSNVPTSRAGKRFCASMRKTSNSIPTSISNPSLTVR